MATDKIKLSNYLDTLLWASGEKFSAIDDTGQLIKLIKVLKCGQEFVSSITDCPKLVANPHISLLMLEIL